ncbi:glycosyltransferase family 4 protein [Anabaena azotica FACHB-119]|uniref:Glycosyltransferase family 4 protein n=2 Tax=Anabaena azotica TaxID=197653 RepID=A0ABR8D435_9NOST|nr:glycosyltransferase family 4 protein [Anabaena azotica FACHB-119]
MRVVIVRRVPGSTHSLEVYADNLVAGLKAVRPDWNIIEVAPQPWNSKDKLWMSGIGLRKYYECFWRHPHAVSQQNADIFHVIDQSDAHIAYWLHRVGKPVVVTCHDLVHFVYPDTLRGQSRFPALSMATWRYSVQGMTKANHVIAVSSHTAHDVAQMLNISPKKITVAPNGVEPIYRVLPQEKVKLLRQQYQASAATICLLNVGGTIPRKNILTVLKVLERLRTEGLSVCLWKTGGQFTSEHKAFIHQHQLEPHIIHFGNPDKETLVGLYNAADILLAPSLYEGFGLTIVEAMACGTPVITANVSSLPEVCNGAAILVNPMDVEAMVESIHRIKQNPDYRQLLIKKGLLRAKFFNWEKTAAQIAEIYENISRKNYLHIFK